MPITGSTVAAASTPPRWAAPPAAAIMTFSPRSSAVFEYSIANSGVRCAEITRVSYATPKLSSVSHAFFTNGQSESDPITMPTNASAIFRSFCFKILSTTIIPFFDIAYGYLSIETMANPSAITVPVEALTSIMSLASLPRSNCPSSIHSPILKV